ncbi:MAG: polymorphic toxin type 50 domain-containing protein [Firmicutes bacterium]|nr:polymorphic toxin type 50 domain-containing protein [Bacillota bacterium]
MTNKQNRDIIKQRVESGEYSLTLSKQQYLKHIQGTPQFEAYEKARLAQSRSSQSKLYISEAEAQEFILSHYATGTPRVTQNKNVSNVEYVNSDKVIGTYCKDGKWYDTKRVAIHYGKKGSHIVPVEEI